MFFALGILLIACQKSLNLDETTILIVDNERISIDQFRNIYELDPTFPGYRKGEAGLKEYLDVLIDKYLAERLAKQEGIFDDPRYQPRLDYERKKAIIQAFYQKEVADRVTVTESELRDAFHKMGIRLQVKHLFIREKSQAEIAYQDLRRGVSFDSLARVYFKDVDPENGGADFGEIGWGELDLALEDTLYQLNPGEYSRPIRSRWGYHILLVVNRKQDMMRTETEYQQQRNWIMKRIKRKKEELQASKYLKEYLDPFQITVKKDAFLKIIQTLDIYDENQASVHFQNFQPFTDKHVALLKARLSSHLNQLFMSGAHSSWTIGDFINKVEQIPINYRPQLSSIGKFKDDIGVVIRNEFLLKEATRKGLDKSARVDSTLRELSRQIAYRHYLKDVFQAMEVQPEVINYYRNRHSGEPIKFIPPESILPGMTTLEGYRYYYAQRELHGGLLERFPDIVIMVNDKLVQDESARINWNNPIRMSVVPIN